MRIVHYHQALRLTDGGVARALLDLCPLQVRLGHEVTLMTSDDRDVPDSWKQGEPGCPRVVNVPAPGRCGRRLSRAALRAVERHIADADIVHVHGMWWACDHQVATLARRLGVAYICSPHGMLDDWSMAQGTLKKRIYMSLFGRRMLNGAAAVHCTALGELEQAGKWFDGDGGFVAPLQLDLEPFEELPGPGPALARFPQLREGRPSVLFLSRLDPKKGLRKLIAAADRLKRLGTSFDLYITGTGRPEYEAPLKQLVGTLRLSDCVHFLGFVSGVEKISLYQAADVFVLPTSQENFGFVLFEALAAGTPVITTRGADTWPELEASGGGKIIDPTPDEIADAIAELLADPDRRRTMGEAGRRWILETMNGTTVRRQLNELYTTAARRAGLSLTPDPVEPDAPPET